MKRQSRRNWFVVLGLFVAVFLFTFLTQSYKNNDKVEAASLASFDPGYIISDYQMGNYNSMNEAAIQNFLKQKGNCNDTRTYLAKSYPQYSYHIKNGHFVCLADETFGEGTAYGDQAPKGESAAHIIYRAAQDYKINPQVLIVLLQKEQGLITDSWPNNVQYRSATGYGCPDTAPCSSEYYGFKNQVRKAAAMFRTVLNGGWTNYPLGNNYIQYNPNAACGGSVVNIRSLATSALYRYTPYQPNAGALAAGYGTASCGAYGNRNFYLYFQDWFGNITFDGWPALSVVMKNNRVASAGSDLGVAYRVHIEHYGWLDWVDNGMMAGTSGYSLRTEALKISLGDKTDGNIEYRVHVSDIGWMNWVKNGELAGTTGQAKKIEALQIKLTGEVSRRYDVYYRVHVSDVGWMNWVKNGELAGTTGQAKKIEALQIKLVKKNLGLGPEYQVHVQDIGWQNWVKDGKTAGTTGKAKRVEAIRIKLPKGIAEGEIRYRVHVQDIGWMNWVKNGELAGTTGRAKRVEAIEIKLSDNLAKKYDVFYRTHVQDIGWMNWVKNGELAGTTGKAKRVEAVEVELVKKQ